MLRDARAVRDGLPDMRPAGLNTTPLWRSVRRMEVLRHIAAGYTTPEIARRMARGEETIKTHTHRILEELGARNRAHAVHLAHRLGLID